MIVYTPPVDKVHPPPQGQILDPPLTYMTYPEPCQVIHIQRQVMTVQRQVITVLFYAKATHGSTKCIQKINGYCTINITTNVNAEGREIFKKYFCIPLFKFKT